MKNESINSTFRLNYIAALLLAVTCQSNAQSPKDLSLSLSDTISSPSTDARNPLTIDFLNKSDFVFEKSGGVDGSGGGSVLDCKTPTGKKYFQLMDYNEANRRNIETDLGPKSLSVAQKIEYVLNRLHKINPTRAERYAEFVNAFQQNSDRREKSNFGKTPDVNDEVIPKNCERVQVIIQINPELPGDKRFIINADIYDQLDSETQAGLILHEVVYYEQKMQSARRVRYFNAWLASPAMEKINLKDYVGLVKLAGLNDFDAYTGIVCKVDLTLFTEIGTLQSASYCRTKSADNFITLPGLKAKFINRPNFWETSYWFRLDSWMLESELKSIKLTATADIENRFTRLLLVDGRITIGHDIQIIAAPLNYGHGILESPADKGTVFDYNSIDYAGKIESDLVSKNSLYIFRLNNYRNWIIRTATGDHLVNNDVRACHSDSGIHITEVTAETIYLERFCVYDNKYLKISTEIKR